jgi:hypothetical protein
MGGVPCHLVTQTFAAHGNLMNEPQPRVTCGPLRTHIHSILFAHSSEMVGSREDFYPILPATVATPISLEGSYRRTLSSY